MYRYITGTLFHFYFREFYTNESKRGQKALKVRILKVFVCLCLSRPSIRKVCSVCFFRLQKFVVCAFCHYTSLQCALFHHKSLQCVLFVITKVCSVRFFTKKVCSVLLLSLQKFVVSAFLLVLQHYFLTSCTSCLSHQKRLFYPFTTTCV